MFPIPDNTTVIEPNHFVTSREKYIMDRFQKHFLELAIWSRALIIALKFNLPNTEDIYKRLLEEPANFQQIMAAYLGIANPNLFRNYLEQFIADFWNLAVAVLANDTQRANESFRKLYQATDNMSEFLYNLNPSTSLEQWHDLLHRYVDMLYSEIYTIFSGDYTKDIELFDSIIDQSYLISDYLSNTVLSVYHPAPATPPATTPQTGVAPSQ